MSLPSVRLLTEAVSGLLDAHSTLTVYRSSVEERRDSEGEVISPAQPPVDQVGRVLGYAILHPGSGDAESDTLARVPGRLLWSFHIMCGGGDDSYWSWTVDTVRKLLDGKTLTVAGAVVGRIQPPFGYQPPPPKPDYGVTPPRLSSPLSYVVLAVPA